MASKRPNSPALSSFRMSIQSRGVEFHALSCTEVGLCNAASKRSKLPIFFMFSARSLMGLADGFAMA
ncbi:uncharacterized protein LAJ45_07805 [Morchella importuna]|uniref:uncharacterized protein n=1 Tax=Morchella importuna TaxID=1174673 RepID=UPI001E8ED084|nr:uncharacterized protein LAJ45_07805 [Morchella importuna]KAH8148041.1 hypothetical protein LAJ45_07805 [Morchella importuna]